MINNLSKETKTAFIEDYIETKTALGENTIQLKDLPQSFYEDFVETYYQTNLNREATSQETNAFLLGVDFQQLISL